jgi:hypothetical protein
MKIEVVYQKPDKNSELILEPSVWFELFIGVKFSMYFFVELTYF